MATVMNSTRTWSFERNVLGGLVAVALLAAVGALITWDIDDYPAWLEAIATTAALAAAVFAARYAFAAFKLETDREERWMAQQRSSQAELIAAWPGGFNHNSGLSHTGDATEPRGLDAVQVTIQNASATPVTNVWIDATLVIQMPDRPHRVHFGTGQVFRVLPPTEAAKTTWFNADTPIDIARFALQSVEPEYWCELSISFRDAGGRDWERIPDGQLLLVQDANAHDKT